MKFKLNKLLGRDNRFRLLLTLGLAVLLPAAALIFVNFSQLRTLKRDKVIEAAFHRDFQDMLAISEKNINKKIYEMTEETRQQFPSASADKAEKEKKFDQILRNSPQLAHVFLFDADDEFVIVSQPGQMGNKYFHKEHEFISEAVTGWFTSEGKHMVMDMQKRSRPISWYPMMSKREQGEEFVTTAFFLLPDGPKDRVVIAGATFDSCYLKSSFFPGMIEEIMTKKLADQGSNRWALMVYPFEMEGKIGQPVAQSAGWGEGKPEVTRRFEGPFGQLALGIKFQGTSIEQLGQTWVKTSFIILGVLSVLMICGVVLTKHIVGKEMALAKLKSDFVSNVSHELRTPLALIRLYAETLELGRITTRDKKQEYYRIIRKESERLTALINNILDFSRIEAGRKEYEFRETDIAELVRNTLDSYRYQIEQQGFAFEENIDPNLPAVSVDREAIARALVNLLNNALKYSADEKFVCVKLYRDNGAVKLEVIDRGIGITRREQSKIFEKFYRTGDPLVHNTKGSGLGLSLVRHITHAHHGDIAVESTPGKGSKFTLSLPLNSATQTPANRAA